MNHTQFNRFNTVVNAPTFGAWTPAPAPRRLQFDLKFSE
jgi:hypothetical protein